jgi:hypothetical protein
LNIIANDQGNTGSIDIDLNGKPIEDDLKGLFDELKKEDFVQDGKLSINLSDSVLIINGKQQPDELLEKLSPYLKNRKKIKFSINLDEKN